MFCPQCGIDNVPNLKFCKRCGTNLDIVSYSLSTPPEKLFVQPLIGREHVKTILWVIAMVVVGGLGMLTGLLVSLAKLLSPGQQEIVGMLGFFGFSALTVIVILLLRLLGRKADRQQEPAIAPAPGRTLSSSATYLAPPAPASVIEQTTSRLPVEEKRTKG